MAPRETRGSPEEFASTWKSPETAAQLRNESGETRAAEKEHHLLLKVARQQGEVDYFALNVDSSNAGSVQRFAVAEARWRRLNHELHGERTDADGEEERLLRIAAGETAGDLQKTRERLLARKRKPGPFPERRNLDYLEGLVKNTVNQSEVPLERDRPFPGGQDIMKIDGFKDAALSSGDIEAALDAFAARSRLRRIERSRPEGQTVSYVDIEQSDPTPAATAVERLGVNKTSGEVAMEIGELQAMLERVSAVDSTQAHRAERLKSKIEYAIEQREKAIAVARRRQ